MTWIRENWKIVVFVLTLAVATGKIVHSVEGNTKAIDKLTESFDGAELRDAERWIGVERRLSRVEGCVFRGWEDPE